MAGYWVILCIGACSCLFNNVSFLSYILTLTLSENCFAELELPATLISEFGCHIGSWV